MSVEHKESKTQQQELQPTSTKLQRPPWVVDANLRGFDRISTDVIPVGCTPQPEWFQTVQTYTYGTFTDQYGRLHTKSVPGFAEKEWVASRDYSLSQNTIVCESQDTKDVAVLRIRPIAESIYGGKISDETAKALGCALSKTCYQICHRKVPWVIVNREGKDPLRVRCYPVQTLSWVFGELTRLLPSLTVVPAFETPIKVDVRALGFLLEQLGLQVSLFAIRNLRGLIWGYVGGS
jgi:hypothetical protein